MADVKSCETCAYIGKSENDYPCNKCTRNASDKWKPMTNADKIRSMSDEELAEFLEQFEVCSHCEYMDKERCTFENPCTHGFATAMALKWLQSEADTKGEQI